ncbi:death domain-associated protein 6-like [Copidosoma floridanum]|uniref:death domain-associated protein 6-like n=1 Tax=Copidosoma floridanum TaxID=29053 RepID=UPI0006C97355|nr:death domain-associated protein 6-like [Copidosoma floridanum]
MSVTICLSSSEDEVIVEPTITVKEKSVQSKDNTECAGTEKKLKEATEATNEKRKLSSSFNENRSRFKKPKFQDMNETVKMINSSSSDEYLSSTSIHDDSVTEITSPVEDITEHYDENEKISPNNKKSKRIQPVLVVKDKVAIPDPSDDVFDNFVKACVNHDKADEETKEILEKLRKKYKKLDSFDKNHEEFRFFLSKCLNEISRKRIKLYESITKVKKEISKRLNTPKTKEPTEEKDSASDEEPTFTEEELNKIRQLEETIKKCIERIKELESEEVILDDDEDSAYMKEDRYKRKLVQLYVALSDIAKDKKLKSELRKKKVSVKDIQNEMIDINVINQSIVDYINSSIKRMNKLKHVRNCNTTPDYIVAPDYHDLLKIVKKDNETHKLHLSEKGIQQYATNALKAVTKYLKKCRIQESDKFLSFFINKDASHNVDPAVNDHALQKTLQQNKVMGEKLLNEVFKKYEDMQDKLTPEELEKQMCDDPLS